jgi:enoyl-CoA hydratase/carnithine racemase
MPVTSAIHDFVAVITFSNPPVNGLGQAIRRGLIDALNEALENDAVKAIVVTGGSQYFSGGADIREFNTPQVQMEPRCLTCATGKSSIRMPKVFSASRARRRCGIGPIPRR